MINESEHVGEGERGMAIWQHPRVGWILIQNETRSSILSNIRISIIRYLTLGTMGLQTRIVRRDGTQKGPWVDGSKRGAAWKAYKACRKEQLTKSGQDAS